MKIGIITQRIGRNYGGTIQNYALQKVLKEFGHEPVTMMLKRYASSKRGEYIYNFIALVKKIMGIKTPLYPSSKLQEKIYNKTEVFLNKYINVSVLDKNEFRKFALHKKLDVFVVGSDQIWRPKYNDSISICYLGFTEELDVKRISYAASFGVDEWEYSETETELAKRLVSKFNAVSVRELSAVNLCKNNLEVKATHVLDPTMLLSKEDYLKLLPINRAKKRDMLFVYLLDETVEKIDIIKQIAKERNLKPYYFMPSKNWHEIVSISEVEDATYKSIEEWIAGFEDASYVVCDSFHGTVFSIIFNKPFTVIGNKERGNTRFDTLLNLFDLQDRIIVNPLKVNTSVDIDWNIIMSKLQQYRKQSFEFLKSSLS